MSVKDIPPKRKLKQLNFMININSVYTLTQLSIKSYYYVYG